MNPRLEKILKLPTYQRVLILCVVLVAIAGGFTYGLFLPKYEELKQLRQRNQQLQAKVEQDRAIAANLPKFKAELEKMQERLNQALSELPNQKEIPGLLSSIASLAKENGLDVLFFRPQGETPKGFYAEVPVELRLSGSYHQVGLFFDAVSNLPRIVNINNLNLGDAKSGGARAALSINCLAITFRFIEGTAK